jgi:hypothetical protein
MAVNLSPLGGAAAQFFTNTGAVLTGGKLYTYAAGTTTPAVTYTTAAGNVPWTNPIVLDAAGRVPNSGEIWLTVGVSYKFVLKDANDVLIATYDDITGNGAATVAVNFTGNGSTVIYSIPGTTQNVYINGVYQNRNTYSVNAGTLTFSEAPPINSIVEVLYY